MRKILVRLAWSCGLLIAIAGSLVALLIWHFYPSPPEPPSTKPTSALATQRQDLAYFKQLLALDRAFTTSARSAAEQRIAALEALPQPIDHAHFRIALMQVTALADNAHTRLGADAGARPRELPVRVASLADGMYVMRAKEAASDLLGGRIVAIDDLPIDAVLARLHTLRGGPPQWRRAYATMYITLQDMLYGLDIAPSADHSTWTVMMPEGTAVTRTLDAYTPAEDEPAEFPKRWLSSEPLSGLELGWKTLQPMALPLPLQDFDVPFRTLLLSDGCARYVQYKSNDDAAGQSIREFTAHLQQQMQARPPCALIMDMRYDDGGNYLKTAYFMRHLVKYTAPGAPIYLLTGPFTFSAGIVSTAFIKSSAGKQVTVLGEEVGDRPQFVAEGRAACLPNYPLCVGYATGKHDYQHPCRDLSVCFWINYLFPSRVTSFAPDQVIGLSFADWSQGHDPVYEHAVELARKHAVRPGS